MGGPEGGRRQNGAADCQVRVGEGHGGGAADTGGEGGLMAPPVANGQQDGPHQNAAGIQEHDLQLADAGESGEPQQQ